MALAAEVLRDYLSECHGIVLKEIRDIIPSRRYGAVLYDMMLEYPLRAGKAFRPSLCIATTRAHGGRLQDVTRTAAVLELYHNAFLIHDDIEDGSLMRRGAPTLHRKYGVGTAVNVGDGMFALALTPLLDNMRHLGMGKALQILELVATMARESVEGQALELDWVRQGAWELADRDYCHMCYKKTCWYTFIAPVLIGATIAGADRKQQSQLRKYAAMVGIAFQIQDDVLNLRASEDAYGKEIAGDLWEGKRTLMLLHGLREAPVEQRKQALDVLSMPREEKTPAQVALLLELIERAGSIEYATRIADRFAAGAARVLSSMTWLSASVHRDFLHCLADYVVSRDK